MLPSDFTKDIPSHPTRVRGLKHPHHGLPDALVAVAPHAGAWIETRLAGHFFAICEQSHPTRVRGLKPVGRELLRHEGKSHPTRVRGLKQVT